jgi:hypothetical protein
MHMDTTPVLSLVLSSSLKSVQIILAPVIPSGCPRAIAPPLLFNFYLGILSVSTEYVA